MKTEEVKKLVDLSRIKVSVKEIKEFTEQLSSVLAYVDKVRDYKFIGKRYDSNDKIARLREDEVQIKEPKEIIDQFSDREGRLLKVKKIL
jgi:aspartyl/glutamyl-tRNA(Asn/Gln) amidotransferase C subunit